jgi:hypothetical protein
MSSPQTAQKLSCMMDGLVSVQFPKGTIQLSKNACMTVISQSAAAIDLEWVLRCVKVAKAKDHVESGVTHLVEAKKLQKSTRRLMCCAIIVLLIIIAVIVILVVKPWTLINKNNIPG